jgi:hypothetical protein
MTRELTPGRALRQDGSAVRPSMAPGVALAAVILCVYGGLALGVDFPRAAIGIQSDEATYYMMGRSLAEDGDLTYRREDLVRVWEDFPGGPVGVFLKRGRVFESAGLMRRPPFVWTATRPDPNPNRYYFGKSFAYPLLAAPFIRLFGVNGFLVVNALLLALAALCGYVFLQARMKPLPAVLLAGGFVMASVVPVYFVWMTPEVMNFSLGLAAYFCWLYKEVAPPGVPPRGTSWLRGAGSDLLAAALIGFLTFSKVSNALLVPPVVAWQLWQRRWRRAAATSAVFAVTTASLFGVNVAITGEWSYQGGERNTFYAAFPLQTPSTGFTVGTTMSRSEALFDVIFDRNVFWTNLGHNLVYAVVGRYAGLMPYFFPAVLALVTCLVNVRRRPAWQFFALAGGLAQLLFFIVGTPYTWNGGGGSVGNRYFMGAYGAFLFALPAVRGVMPALLPWAAGSLFLAPLVMNPFVASFYPGRNAAAGPLRMLPVELTLVYDLPVNTEPSRVKQAFGDNPGENDPPFQIYFLDDAAFGPEPDKTFWVQGEARADFLIKTDRPMRRLVLTLTAGAADTTVRATVDGHTERLTLAAGSHQVISFTLGNGFPYQDTWPVWTASISSSGGFVPALSEDGSTDTRYLGVRVKPRLIAR